VLEDEGRDWTWAYLMTAHLCFMICSAWASPYSVLSMFTASRWEKSDTSITRCQLGELRGPWYVIVVVMLSPRCTNAAGC
jgi:hypothetical protein